PSPPRAEGARAGAPPKEASGGVGKAKRGDRPIALPSPSKPRPASRHVTRFSLANGISVVVQESPANATFALRGSIPAGSIVEPRDRPGLASLTASMLTRGTEKRNALEFATALENVGASLGASGGGRTTAPPRPAQSKGFDLLLDPLAEMLRQATVPAGAPG